MNYVSTNTYDNQTVRWFTPDPAEQFHNPYLAMGNNPVMYVDPDGEFAWFVPVIIGAAVGAYAGGAIAAGDGGLSGANWNPFGGAQGSWQGTDWYKGAIVGGLLGATAGSMFSAAFAPTALGTTGFQATGMVAAGKATAGWGITTSALQGATINMGISAISGGGWDEAYKSGLVGAASGAFAATGGFGMAKAWGAKGKFAKLAGKLGYQAVGTAGTSIGQNWVNGDDLFSRVTVGVGPVNLTFGEGEKLLQARNNIGNIAFNAVGLTNAIAGGKIGFDVENLSPIYSGGFVGQVYNRMGIEATGAHSVLARHGNISSRTLAHEMNHIWHSRSLGDLFIPNYLFQGIYPSLMGVDQYYGNYFERIGEFGF